MGVEEEGEEEGGEEGLTRKTRLNERGGGGTRSREREKKDGKRKGEKGGANEKEEAHAAFAHSHSPGYVPQAIQSSRRDAPVQTRPGNVSARILKRNQFATSARY